MMLLVSGERGSTDNTISPVRREVCGSRRCDGAGNDGGISFKACYIIGFLFCLTKMKPKSRIILTWFYTVICACVTGSLVARYHYLNKLAASPTDMREIDMVSTTFCESVTVTSSSPITVYKFYSVPEIGNTYTDFYRRVSTNLERDEYQYWGFYLLKGSIITARVCGRAYLYRIVGKDKLNQWIGGSHRDSSDGGPILTNYCGSGIYQPIIVNVTATKSEQYYFLFLNTVLINGQRTNVKVDFVLQRKFYMGRNNVSTIVCMESSNCTVPLSAQSSETVVFYVPDHVRTDEIQVISRCKPRVYMYILVFGILPFLIGTLITCAIVKFTRKRNTETDRPGRSIFTVSDNEDETLQGYINENFQLQLSPPSYAEVQSLSSPSYSEAPPSYDEAVSNNQGKEMVETRSN
ncbi:uncharacterized protein LOC123554825 [Mercenaria mercenaria]|uniref:uncharacterized protein LOC123554825 n=1 Tax=Mercenaria mercenaria TaxID=6596 RepID=UPI00234F1015|nr:uncharacterized protein LOC123554825 [Mercenaria mercenaria]